MPADSCLCGMRYCPYWVFLSTGQHYDLALQTRYCEWGYDDTDEKMISCSDGCQMDAESERKPHVLNINLTISFELSLFLSGICDNLM
jgi:hypothetical protein